MTDQAGWRDLLDAIKWATATTKAEEGWLVTVVFFPYLVLVAVAVWSVVRSKGINTDDTDDTEKVEAAKERSADIEDWSELKTD